VVADGNEKHLQLGEKEGEVRWGPISDERDRGVELTEGGDSWWRRLRIRWHRWLSGNRSGPVVTGVWWGHLSVIMPREKRCEGERGVTAALNPF
jgi:hypothetical protein